MALLLDPDTPRSDRDPEARAAAAPDDSPSRGTRSPRKIPDYLCQAHRLLAAYRGWGGENAI